ADPKYAYAWLRKGDLLAKLGKHEEASEAYDKAIEADPKYAFAWASKCYLLAKDVGYKKALKVVNKAIKVNPKDKLVWIVKGEFLAKLGKHEKALKAYEKVTNVKPKRLEDILIHSIALIGYGVSLSALGRYESALRVIHKAIDSNPKDVMAHNALVEIFLELGNHKSASEEVEKSLRIDEKSVDTWALKGRIEIEKQEYDKAIESFKKSITLNIANALLILWYVYANYLKAEFTVGTSEQRYQEKMLFIIRELERAEKLSRHDRKEDIKAHILYFLGCFYHKSKDFIRAKKKLHDCLKLRSKIKASARELLENIWNYQIRPPMWRYWLASPVYCWPKRLFFILVLLGISSLFLFHIIIPAKIIFVFDGLIFVSDGLKINWNIYSFLIVILIFILLSPMIRRIKAKEIEIEIHSPLPFELALSTAAMAEIITKLEKDKTVNR
ncbi:MAG: tetratricopeptide repeat protein, partial [candidate division Zixibacteria bacterium]|nr:tetratricopeptide repeat protein [candidate division Zixibacteria bacterium]